MKKQRVAIGVLLAVVLTLFALPLTASAQNTWHVSKWTKYVGNPVLNPGSAGEWDDTYVNSPDVLYDGATYRMWYSGDDGITYGIGYATSPDGITWTKHPGNPVLNPGSAGEWDDAGVYRPDVLYDGTTYHMWYDGFGGITFSIGYATSPDGITWTKYAGNPVLNPGSAGEWDDAWLYSPGILYDGANYHMWYDGSGGSSSRIGYATSPDGITWSKHDNPATTTPYAESDPIINPGSAGEWDDAFINRPDVLYDGTTYHMWYGGDDASVTYRIGYATSTNGITWSKYDDPTTTAAPYAESDPVLNPGPPGEWDDACIYSPGILYDGTTYHMWYSSVDGTNRRIGYATNSYIDADFLSIQNAIEFAGPEDTILVHPTKYNEKLLINKSLTLQSTDGWQNTMIDPVTDSIIRIQGAVEVTVQGFDISGGSWGIHVGSAEKKVNILDCFIHHNSADGIYVAGGGDLLNIERNIISANGNPGGGCGIYIEQAWSTVNILDNTVGSFGILCPTSSSSMNVSNGDGIRIDDVPTGTDVTINDNFIGANEDDGIDFAPPGSSVDGNVTIEDNIIGPWEYWYDECRFLGGRNADDGIHIGEVSDTGSITIEDNKISENGADGINFGLGVSTISGNVIIRDNLIGGWTYYPEDSGAPVRYNGNGGEGIYIFQVGDTGAVNIEGNKISENAIAFPHTGIDIREIYGVVTIAGNDIGAWEDMHGENYLGNEGQGIFVVDVFSGGELTIGPDNSIEENTGHGIDVAYGALDATIEIHHNVLNDNDPVACGCGIKLGSGGVYGAIVSDNIVTNHHEGIHLDENSQKNTVQYNEISDNDHGIWVAGKDNEIWGNDILNNKMLHSGIHLTGSATGNKSYCNNIAGNGSCGVRNENPNEEADARYNWWGCSGGPEAAGCDTASAYVAYTPWLKAPGPDGDLDLLTCRDELEHGTDPNNPDTDGGGVKDGIEVAGGMDPLDPADDAPPSPIGVGGEAYPVNKLVILAPWIALAVAIIAGAAIVARRRRTQG